MLVVPRMLSAILPHPSGIFHNSVLPFLTLQNFLYLDTAACRRDLRERLLMMARSRSLCEQFMYQIDRTIIRWIVSRQVHLPVIQFDYSVTDDDLLSMGAIMVGCQRLSLTNCRKVKEETAIALLDNCTRLTYVDLGDSKLSCDTVVTKIAEMNHDLKTLSIMGYHDNLSDAAILAVARNCPTLTNISLTSCKEVTGAALVTLVEACPTLTQMHLRTCSKAVTDEVLVQIAPRLAGLLSLIMHHCDAFSDVGLLAVAAHCPLLVRVDIGWNHRITDVGVIALAKACPQLQSLEMSFVEKITNASMQAIVEHCKLLRVLDLQCCRAIREDGYLLVQQLVHLRALHFGGCYIGDAVVTGIAPHCPELQKVDLSCCGVITDESITLLARHCPKLASLDLSTNDDITDASLAALAQHCKYLQKLDLQKCEKITGAGVIQVAQGCSLEELNIFACPLVTAADVAVIRRCVEVVSSLF